MRVGFGKVDVTPFEPVHLGSYGGALKRLSTEVRDNFYALTLAITDEDDKTLLLVLTDLTWGTIWHANILRENVLNKYGIPGECVMLGGLHNHNGPDILGAAEEMPPNLRYAEFWHNGIMESIEMALADRKEIISTEIARGKTEGLAFVRRYWREDGNFLSGGPKKYSVQSDSPIVRHESEADEELQMLRWRRQGGKDIVIGQWQNHGCHFGNTTIAGTDWMGPMREHVEKEIDCHYFYMQGAAGNLDSRSRVPGEHIERDTDEYGQAVGDAFISVFRDDSAWTTVQSKTIRTMQGEFSAVGGNEKEWTGELNTIALGDVSIVTLPIEAFDAIGKEIKDKTPYKMTLIMGYTNGVTGYVPTREAYMNGGYEAHSRGVADTGERFVEAYLTSLNKLYRTNL